MSRFRILFIDEINARNHFKSFTVRFIGKLRSYLPGAHMGIMVDSDQRRNSAVRVDFQNVVDISLKSGSYYQIVGEALCDHTGPLTVRATLVRNVDGVDMKMYRQAVRDRRAYLNELS
ncbi:uncharacterized protein TNIN_230191 [Trichonephila inaurata madagascariensis]|uniref:Uncharacterized protein n=1 Tax=Trichonephila inaurata madagascariensis TaxID=2747483 RepID=A0A8X7C0A5_9ARAC|nr:uncharacterized protein TNIN_230191 [Trichonephila inaurata madagascariensis]